MIIPTELPSPVEEVQAYVRGRYPSAHIRIIRGSAFLQAESAGRWVTLAIAATAEDAWRRAATDISLLMATGR